jgi:hypothetical protein
MLQKKEACAESLATSLCILTNVYEEWGFNFYLSYSLAYAASL